DVADKAAGLAYQQRARRQIPRRQIALPISVEAAGRDPGEIERRRAIAAQSGEGLLRGGDLVPRKREITTAIMRQSAGDDRVPKPLPRGNTNTLVVEKRALAALGNEHFVIGRIV